MTAGLSLPPYARKMLAFDFLNAVCFTIALGSPMILTVRFLGGGEALIGFLIALTPLLTMLQIPAVRYAERWGYQRLMMAGWRIRAVMVLLLAPLPLLVGHVPAGVILLLFTLLLMLFNLIRGFASGCWLPWMKTLIPADRLGRFLSRESMAMGLASLLTLLGCGWFLGQTPPAWHYAVILLISGLGGLASVLPLRTVPHAGGTGSNLDQEVAPTQHLLRRVWAQDDFRKLIYFMACNNASLAATGGFLVLYLKETAGLSAGDVVVLTALGSVGSMLAAIPMGKYLDRVGSKPVMRAASIAYLAIFTSWLLHAVFHLPAHFLLVAFLVFIGGMIGTGSGLATGRLMIQLCPHDQATAGMALAQVAQATASGLATVLWGFLLQGLRAEGMYGQHSRVPFILFFLITLTGLAGAYQLLFQVREPTAMSSSRFLRNLALEWPRSWLRP